MIVFMGVSGAGKGTQSQLLGRDLAYSCLSTGEILRTFATEAQQQQILHGDLLADSDMFEIVHMALLKQEDQNAIILDGFPRTEAQVEWLVGHAKENTYRLEAVINLQVSAEVVHERLEKRGRADDTPEAIKHRIAFYNQNAQSMIAYYQKHNVPFYNIDGNGELSDIHSSIMKLLQRSSTL